MSCIWRFPQDIEILGWCPAGPVLPHGEKVPLYQYFECCQRGFALLHSIQDSGERDDLLIQRHLHKNKWDLLSLKPCLNLCSLRTIEPRSNLINSFIPYGLQILKIPLGEGLVNSKIISLKILIFSEFFQCRIQKKFGDMGFSWGFSRFWKPH